MATQPTKLIYFSRSGVETDWSCPRMYYWKYHHSGTGIVPVTESLDTYLGTRLHDALAGIATCYKNNIPLDIDVLATTAHTEVMTALAPQDGEVQAVQFAHEQAALVEGLIRGFHRHVWPRLIAQYPTVLEVEREVTYEYNGLCFMSKPDLIMESPEGLKVYIEYKSTSSKKENWINLWGTAIQLHSSVKPVEATLGYKPDIVQVIGAYKGYESYGKLSSALVYGYVKKGNPPFTKDMIDYVYKAGWRRTPTWEFPGGVKQWVAQMPDTILSEQFPFVPPIFPKDHMIESFFIQRDFREHEVAMAKQLLQTADAESAKGILDVAFPQFWKSCDSYFGRSCDMKQICHGKVADPLTAGFIPRASHHVTEADALKKSGKVE